MMTKTCSVCKADFDSYFWDHELRLILCKSCKINLDKYEKNKVPAAEWLIRFEKINGPHLLSYKQIARHLQRQLKMPFLINMEKGIILFRFEVLNKRMIKKLSRIEGPINIGNNFISFMVEEK